MWSVLYAGLAFMQAIGFSAALEHAPEVPSVVGAREAGKRRADEAEGMMRLIDNPLLEVQPGGRSLAAGGRDVEFYMSVSQRFRLNGAGKKRQESVRREVRQDEDEAEVALREARLRIASAWLARWAAQELVTLAQSEMELAEALGREMQVALSAGEATQVDVGLVQGFGAEAELLALSSESSGFSWGIELARAMGLTAEASIVAEGEPPAIDVPGEAELRRALSELDRTARVKLAKSAREAEQARLLEAKAEGGMQFGVGAQAFREGGGDVAGIALFELVLPVFERNKRGSSAAQAALSRAEQAERAALIDAHGERLARVFEVVQSERVLTLTSGGLLTAAEKVAEAQRKRLEAREATTQDWVLARRAVLKARAEVVQARVAHTLARFRARELLLQVGSSP